MGQAKYNRVLRTTAERVHSVLYRMATAASSQLGSDCYIHAAIGQYLMADLGFSCAIRAGQAAWRVGPGDGDVINHVKQEGYLPAGAKGFAYHAWLEVSDYILDFTTYQLPRKASDLDQFDGGKTTVDWCPDFLLASMQSVQTYAQVAQALTAPAFFYAANEELAGMLADTFTFDSEDLEVARFLLAHPDIQVVGPNNKRAAI